MLFTIIFKEILNLECCKDWNTYRLHSKSFYREHKKMFFEEGVLGKKEGGSCNFLVV